jgi:hypothetical protein
MKNFLSILILLISIQITAQEKISTEKWQTDLRFLQKTVHDDFSFLFKKVTSKDFDASVDAFYNEIPTLKDHQILFGFSKIVALFQYGHTDINLRNAPVKYHKMPLKIYQFSDGVYITSAHKDYRNAIGAKIIEIEGVAIKDVLKAIEPVVPVENEQFFKAYGISYALIPEVLHTQGITKELKQKITVRLEKKDREFDISINAVKDLKFPLKYDEVKLDSDWIGIRDQSKTPLYLKNLDKRYYYEYLPKKKSIYVRYSQVWDDKEETTHAFFKRVFDFVDQNEVEKFILDVRLNGGGNNFKNKQVITNIIKRDKINQKGKLFVIIGRRTFSAAQNLVNELDNYTNVTFVGEPTAENINFYGDSKRITLQQSKLHVRLSFAWWQDKAPWANAEYTRPDYFVDPSFQDYISNKDTALEVIFKPEKTNE